jgi:hypothetical protein
MKLLRRSSLQCYLRLFICSVLIITSSSVLNQKAFKWVDLTESELHGWYSPADLCILNSTDYYKFPQDTRANDCYAHSKGSRRQWCGVGMGNNNYACYGPFSSARSHFKKGIDGFTSPSSKPLLSLFANLHLTNTTLVLLGDSTMRQKLQALQCEVTRETNGLARFHGNIFGILPCDTVLTIYFPNYKRFSYPKWDANPSDSLAIHPLSDASLSVHAISLGPKSIECYEKRITKEQKCCMDANNDYRLIDNVSSGSSSVADSSSSASSSSMLSYQKMSKKQRLETEGIFGNAAYLMNEINFQQNRSVYILANIGLWYNDPDDYAAILPYLMDWFASLAKRSSQLPSLSSPIRNIVAWHETLRQHWQNTDDSSGQYIAQLIESHKRDVWGENNLSFVPLQSFAGEYCCSPIKNSSFLADWRNRIVHDLLFHYPSAASPANANPSPVAADNEYRKYITLFPLAEIS